MPTVFVIPPELAICVEEQAVDAGYRSALDYLYALVISDRRAHLDPIGTSLTKQDMDALRSVPGEQMTAVVRRQFQGPQNSSLPCGRFEVLAPADFRIDRDQADER